jgi:hypothetical protein
VSSREIDGSVITLSASGWTYFSTFVLYDYETESLWFPISGVPGFTCVGGFYADRYLDMVPATVTTWSAWKQQHPGSKYMPANAY